MNIGNSDLTIHQLNLNTPVGTIFRLRLTQLLV